MLARNKALIPRERRPPRPGWPEPRQAIWLAVGYAAVMLYSSTIIGPAGPHFVARDPAEAFRAFRAMRFVAHGSDQRADWIGNLLMLAPFGFLVTAALWPRRGRMFRLFAGLLALLACVATILAIKYLQLFFPPRTVTLNYVTAQTLGALCGCAGFAFWHERLDLPAHRRDPVSGLVTALRLYLAALSVFLLMPLDFALDATDIQAQIARLPETLMTLPGAGRPWLVRMAALLAAILVFVPVGVLLAFARVRPSEGDPALNRTALALAGPHGGLPNGGARNQNPFHGRRERRLALRRARPDRTPSQASPGPGRRPGHGRDDPALAMPRRPGPRTRAQEAPDCPPSRLGASVYRMRRGPLAVASLGLMITTGLFVLSTMVLGATPALASIAYRLAGIMAGTLGLRWLVRQDMDRLLRALRALAVWLAVPYVGAVLLVTGLLSWQWRSPAQAVAQAYPLGLLPLFDYYIVSKAEAAKNVVGHLLMYWPIGVALWLRHPQGRVGGRAFLLGCGLSLAVELGRYLRPGLEGDINAVALAGLAATLGAWLAPRIGWFLLAVVRQSNGQGI